MGEYREYHLHRSSEFPISWILLPEFNSIILLHFQLGCAIPLDEGRWVMFSIFFFEEKRGGPCQIETIPFTNLTPLLIVSRSAILSKLNFNRYCTRFNFIHVTGFQSSRRIPASSIFEEARADWGFGENGRARESRNVHDDNSNHSSLFWITVTGQVSSPLGWWQG